MASANHLADLPLMTLIPTLCPDYQSPWHLAGWVDMLERAARGEPVRGLCAVPIRHGKTECTNIGVVHMLLKDPSRQILHMSHSFERAQTIGKRIRQLARAAGVGPERGNDTIQSWQNDAGGGVTVMSSDMSRLGYNVHAFVMDDGLDEHGFLDARKREEVDQNCAHYVARCTRNGREGSALIVGSRGHPDDPIGRRLLRRAVAWEYISSPAIIDEGLPTERAFAPQIWPLDALKRTRAELKEKDPTERVWNSQFQNDPRAAGGELFRGSTRYTTLPDTPFRTSYGADFAFTQGDTSDWFVIVVGRIYGRKLFIVDCQRHKIDATMIESECKRAIATYGRAAIFSYQSGPEKGMSQVLVERGVPISVLPARYNKLVRAERTIRRWNDGEIIIPDDSLVAAWVPGFLARLEMFRGNDKDGDDDEVDALTSLADGALGGGVTTPVSFGRPRV